VSLEAENKNATKFFFLKETDNATKKCSSTFESVVKRKFN
jgi:hypothetical protein